MKDFLLLPHYVVVDLTSPMNSVLAEKCLLAVENVITWGCFMCDKGTQFGVICIDSNICSPRIVLTCNNRTSTDISTALRGISKQFKDGIQVTTSDFEDLLMLAVNTALKEKPVASLTVLSCREGRLLARWLDTLSHEIASAADSFQVVELSRSDVRQQTYFSALQSCDMGRPATRLAVVPVAAVSGSGQTQSESIKTHTQYTSLEAVLRAAWFTPRWSEMLPLQLSIGHGVDLECVASPSVADPSSLPVASSFLLAGAAAAGSAHGGGRSGAGTALQALCRVAADGVCEGSLFGAPLRVLWAPPSTSAFRGNDQLYRQNAHAFLALCESLAEADEFLVLRRQLGVGQAASAAGHFVVMPGDDCLLLRAVASAELALPAPAPPPLQYDGLEAERAGREVRDALDGLARTAQYSALRFPSNLCAALKMTARFPGRLSLGTRTLPTAPAGARKCPPQHNEASDDEPRQGGQDQGAAAAEGQGGAAEVLSTDEEEEEDLVEENLPRPLLARVKTSAAPTPMPHKLGTGGHPALLALDPDRRSATKRKKAPTLFGMFKVRRT